MDQSSEFFQLGSRQLVTEQFL